MSADSEGQAACASRRRVDSTAQASVDVSPNSPDVRRISKPVQSCVSLLPEENPRRGVKLPARRPRSARFVGWVSWSWSPGHSRDDALYLSLDSHRKHWLLWLEWSDDGWFESEVRAYVKRRDLSAVDAARMLVECWYVREEREYSDIEGRWMEVVPGLLPEADFENLARKIWPAEEENVQEKSQQPRPDPESGANNTEVSGSNASDAMDLVRVGLRAAANLKGTSAELLEASANFALVQATVAPEAWERNYFLPADFGRIQTYLRGNPVFKIVVTRWPDGIRFTYFPFDRPITGYLVPNRLRETE